MMEKICIEFGGKFLVRNNLTQVLAQQMKDRVKFYEKYNEDRKMANFIIAS